MPVDAKLNHIGMEEFDKFVAWQAVDAKFWQRINFCKIFMTEGFYFSCVFRLNCRRCLKATRREQTYHSIKLQHESCSIPRREAGCESVPLTCTTSDLRGRSQHQEPKNPLPHTQGRTKLHSTDCLSLPSICSRVSLSIVLPFHTHAHAHAHNQVLSSPKPKAGASALSAAAFQSRKKKDTTPQIWLQSIVFTKVRNYPILTPLLLPLFHYGLFS